MDLRSILVQVNDAYWSVFKGGNLPKYRYCIFFLVNQDGDSFSLFGICRRNATRFRCKSLVCGFRCISMGFVFSQFRHCQKTSAKFVSSNKQDIYTLTPLGKALQFRREITQPDCVKSLVIWSEKSLFICL